MQETEDPYSFDLLLSETDLHLFNEGRLFEIAFTLGANPMTVDGVRGTRFAVWAPNARAVSVIGDFDTWDNRRHPMRLRYPSGVWELFVPRVGPGTRYKFAIVGPDGTRLPDKADPLAKAAEAAARHRFGRCRSRSRLSGTTKPGCATGPPGMALTRRSRSTRCMRRPGSARVRA